VRRGNTINMRRWPRSTAVYIPTKILTTGDRDVEVLTTVAGHAHTPTERTAGVFVSTVDAAAHSATTGTHNVSLASLVTAASHPLSSTTRDLTFGVHTTIAANTAIGLGWVPLVDESGNPILDEGGNPIYVLGQGSEKNAVAAPNIAAAADARAAVAHNTSLAALITAAAHPLSVTSRDLTFGVHTSVAAHAGIGLTQWVTLLDEFGEPILDENGDEILVEVAAASEKNTPVVSVVTVAGHTIIVATRELEFAVHTSAAAHTSASSSRSASVTAHATAAAAPVSDSAKSATPSVATTLAASLQTVTVHSLATGVHTSAALITVTAGTHHVSTGSGAHAGAHSASSVAHNVSVSALTTAAVHITVFREPDNSISVAVWTGSGADSRTSPIVHASTPLTVVTIATHTAAGVVHQAVPEVRIYGAADTATSPVGHQSVPSVSTTAAAETRAGPLGHDISAGVHTTVGGHTTAGPLFHEAFVGGGAVFGGASVSVSALHSALVQALTTGSAYTAWNELIAAMCVALLIDSDTVSVSISVPTCDVRARADTVTITVQEC
jgi:hypothetical protein